MQVGGQAERLHWWQGRGFVAAAAVASVVPLVVPATPPLVDLPGHIGRYRILVEAGSPPLAKHYAVHWAPIGNLGVDLLVIALHPLLDVEPAARAIAIAIPVLTVLAMLWAAREAHGRLPPAAAWALPLAYAYPFQLGFLNFCLAQALAFAGLAGWIRLARTRPPVWRIVLAAPYAGLVWLCHSAGWGMLGLFVAGAEVARRREAGQGWAAAAVGAGLYCLPMAWPALLMLGGAASVGDTGDWKVAFKLVSLASLLRERWEWWDAVGAFALVAVAWTGLRSPRLTMRPVLAYPALLCLVAFIALPRLLQGGSYVDSRMLPAAVALALLAIAAAPGEKAMEQRLASAGAVFLGVRTLATTAAFLLFAREGERALAALPALDRGTAVLVLVNEPSSRQWSGPRLTHIAGLAIARRRVFTNEQWAIPGQQIATPMHPRAAPFDRDPSQLVYPAGERFRLVDFDDAIRSFDRCTFQQVWTIEFPAARAHAADLKLVWNDDRSAVYRVDPAACSSPSTGRR